MLLVHIAGVKYMWRSGDGWETKCCKRKVKKYLLCHTNYLDLFSYRWVRSKKDYWGVRIQIWNFYHSPQELDHLVRDRGNTQSYEKEENVCIEVGGLQWGGN